MWLFCLLDPFIPTQIKFLATPLEVYWSLYAFSCPIAYVKPESITLLVMSEMCSFSATSKSPVVKPMNVYALRGLTVYLSFGQKCYCN